MHKVLVADGISDIGIDQLKADPDLDVDVRIGISPEDLLADAAQYHGIIVRSATKITPEVIEKASNLKCVGRAGVGVDNIDIPTATKNGVIVMNTPTGNTISTAEHAFTLMMALARKIPQAHANVISGKFEKKKFQGVELYKKTLAILGMGRIGTEYARRAMAFGMRVVAYDPYLSASKARLLQVELVDDPDDAVKEADFITLHMPMTPETKHIINADRIQKMKPGVRIINCARGGLLDEKAVEQGMAEGIVAGCALDVFEEEPPPADFSWFEKDNVVLTPHLGASTAEAQENVGIDIAKQVRNCLVDGTVVNSVNTPSIDEATISQVGPYLELCEGMGRMLSQIAPKRVESLSINYSGKVSDLDTTLISRSAMKGYLEQAGGSEVVNHINAPSFAENLGIKTSESRMGNPADYTELIEVVVSNDEETASVAGTFFAGKPRIVKINEHNVETEAEGIVLLIGNNDQPGVVGAVGQLLEKENINIANMSLSRNVVDKVALMVLNLDGEPDISLKDDLLADERITSAKLIKL
ncbi:MAG: phosphoglycerate dehydrogenase [Verrucomicrobiota bacterium]